jgi:hypothetical protein
MNELALQKQESGRKRLSRRSEVTRGIPQYGRDLRYRILSTLLDVTGPRVALFFPYSKFLIQASQ